MHIYRNKYRTIKRLKNCSPRTSKKRLACNDKKRVLHICKYDTSNVIQVTIYRSMRFKSCALKKFIFSREMPCFGNSRNPLASQTRQDQPGQDKASEFAHRRAWRTSCKKLTSMWETAPLPRDSRGSRGRLAEQEDAFVLNDVFPCTLLYTGWLMPVSRCQESNGIGGSGTERGSWLDDHGTWKCVPHSS